MDEDENKMLFNKINNLKDFDHPKFFKINEFFEDEKRYQIVKDIQKEVSYSMKFQPKESSLKMMLQC